mgnify:CR=1 FL=1
MIEMKKLGRKLTYKEIVPHINGKKKDNRIENLEIINRSIHIKEHQKRGDIPLKNSIQVSRTCEIRAEITQNRSAFAPRFGGIRQLGTACRV